MDTASVRTREHEENRRNEGHALKAAALSPPQDSVLLPCHPARAGGMHGVPLALLRCPPAAALPYRPARPEHAQRVNVRGRSSSSSSGWCLLPIPLWAWRQREGVAATVSVLQAATLPIA